MHHNISKIVEGRFDACSPSNVMLQYLAGFLVRHCLHANHYRRSNSIMSYPTWRNLRCNALEARVLRKNCPTHRFTNVCFALSAQLKIKCPKSFETLVKKQVHWKHDLGSPYIQTSSSWAVLCGCIFGASLLQTRLFCFLGVENFAMWVGILLKTIRYRIYSRYIGIMITLLQTWQYVLNRSLVLTGKECKPRRRRFQIVSAPSFCGTHKNTLYGVQTRGSREVDFWMGEVIGVKGAGGFSKWKFLL